MLVWAGFIGKLVELIVAKVIGKHVDFRLDERKVAAKSFLSLHESVEQLEGVVREFLVVVQPVLDGQKPRLYRAPLAAIATVGDEASRKFSDSLHELHQVILFYDTNLPALLNGIARMKQGLLITAAASKMQFKLIPNPKSVFSVACTSPTKNLMAANLEESYNAAREIRERLDAVGISQ